MQAETTAVGPAASPWPTIWRLRIAAVCVVLTALAFVQAPGSVVADTKVDLIVNPVGWLERATHLWTSAGTFGQLQDQAYGYLWPMGPFFVAGSWLGIPGWAVQRLWWALLMCVAFTGLVKLAGRLGIGSPTTRLIAGVAFALSPRVLTQLGTNSVEAWPTAVAPWVLVPLIGLAKGASIRRSVALSALAVACAGGVNGTAVVAVLPLGLLWLATLRPLRRRVVAMAAWCVAVVCATAWWVVPLLILGRYSPPFLDYIETAEVTTRLTDVVTNLRGASYWLAYLGGPYGPALPAGWRLATETVLIVATIGVATIGIVGLARRGMPHRRFLVTALLAGVALVGLGHASDLDSTISAHLREFLDGVGSPLRNVHKFDVLLRLPLTLGLAHALGVVRRAGAFVRNGQRPARPMAAVATVAVVAVVLGSASPALAGRLAPSQGISEVPGYWHEAADWLDAHEGLNRVLVVPGASFPDYDWGRATDEITQPLLRTDWAVRNAIPLTPPTTIRLLDAVENALSTGDGSAGLADLLARSGVRYVLVRSDLDYGRSASLRPIVVRQALARSPGFSVAAEFGPSVGGARPGGAFVDHGLDLSVRALEILRVERAVDPVVAYDLKDVKTVVGGPESLLSLAAAGQLGSAPTVLAGDLNGRVPAGPVVVTDGLRRRDVAFGQLHDNKSATMTADDRYDTVAPAHDYLPAWAAGQSSTIRYSGVRSVSASTSLAQANVLGGNRPEHQPYAALDDDPGTSWRTATGTEPVGQWLELALARPQEITEVTLHFDLSAGAVPNRVTVTAGNERATVEFFGAEAVVKLPGVHATRTVRVTIDGTISARPGANSIGISEVDLPGLVAERTLVVPKPPGGAAPASMVLTAAPSIASCFFADAIARCSPSAARGSEDGDRIDRTVTLSADGSYVPTVWARPRPGLVLNALLDQRVAAATHAIITPSVVASSTMVADPAGRPGAVMDGDPGTAWSPAADDANPVLQLTWPKTRTISGLRLTLPDGYAATRPGLVRVIGDGGLRGGFLDSSGTVTFDPPMRTDELTISFLDAPSARSVDPYANTSDVLPIAVGELTLLPDPARAAADPDTSVDLPCGSGPTLRIGTASIRTRIAPTLRDLLELREVVAQPCVKSRDLPQRLAGGEQRLIATPSEFATPTRVALVADRPATAQTPSRVAVVSWSDNERRVSVGPRDVKRVLAVRENTNPGWRATVGGQTLVPIVLDGWQQGWVLPAGVSGEVILTFVPDAAYRLALLVGAALLVVVLGLALVPSRRRGAHAPARLTGRARRHGRLVPLAVGGGALVLTGGPVGVLVAAAGALAVAYRAPLPYPSGVDPRRARRLSRALQTWLPVVALLVAGWLSLTTEDSHWAAGPQIAGIVAVAGLWLSVVGRPAPRPASTPTLKRSLYRVVADRRQHQPAAEGGQVGLGEIPREQWPIGQPIDGFQYEQVPQEKAVRDGA